MNHLNPSKEIRGCDPIAIAYAITKYGATIAPVNNDEHELLQMLEVGSLFIVDI